jgi:hypothetical protein
MEANYKKLFFSLTGLIMVPPEHQLVLFELAIKILLEIGKTVNCTYFLLFYCRY